MFSYRKISQSSTATHGSIGSFIGMSCPVRTCVVCRNQVEKAQLLRFVRSSSGELRLDLGHRIAGRGAYCHCSVECLGTKKAVSLLIHSLNCRKGKPKTVNTDMIHEILKRDVLAWSESVSRKQFGEQRSAEVRKLLSKLRKKAEKLAGPRVLAKNIRL